MARGGDDFYGMPMVALRQWFVLAAEYDLLAVPVIAEHGVLVHLDLVLVQGSQWVSERFTRAQLLQNDPGKAIEYCCGKLADDMDRLERRIPFWRDENFTVQNLSDYTRLFGPPKGRGRITYDED